MARVHMSRHVFWADAHSRICNRKTAAAVLDAALRPRSSALRPQSHRTADALRNRFPQCGSADVAVRPGGPQCDDARPQCATGVWAVRVAVQALHLGDPLHLPGRPFLQATAHRPFLHRELVRLVRR